MRGWTVWIALACLLTRPICQTALTASNHEYTLDTGDVLSVVVVNHPEFSNEYAVPPDGRVLFHGAGEILVRGLTLRQVEEQLRTALRKRLREPVVSVSLKQARPMLVFVEGQVGKPGAYPIQPGWRLFEAIAAAEGLKILPERAVALLLRGEQTIPLDLVALYHRGDPAANIPLQPGDKISIQQRLTIRVYVSGQVNMPGVYDLEVGSGVVQAIAAAQGYHPENASLSRAFIDRKGTIIPVNLYAALVEGRAEQNIPLQDGDLLVVPTNLSRFAIIGQVERPGYYLIPEGKPMLLSDAVALAGGVTPRALTSRVYVLRLENGELKRLEIPYQRFLKRGDPAANPPVREGDVIYLAETKRLDYGEVTSALSTLAVLWGSGLLRGR
ncbi:MAG: SLBB domain-containing protein [Armatimonadota bacterium]